MGSHGVHHFQTWLRSPWAPWASSGKPWDGESDAGRAMGNPVINEKSSQQCTVLVWTSEALETLFWHTKPQGRWTKNFPHASSWVWVQVIKRSPQITCFKPHLFRNIFSYPPETIRTPLQPTAVQAKLGKNLLRHSSSQKSPDLRGHTSSLKNGRLLIHPHIMLVWHVRSLNLLMFEA